MRSMFVSRRSLLGAAAGATVAFGSQRVAAAPAAAYAPLVELERRSGGRLGVAMLDTGNGSLAGHRLDERFGLCSMFKLPLAAVILSEADQGRLALDRRVHYVAADVHGHAPVTTKHLARGYMTVAELAEAAQVTSDNPAANLLLKLIGGPAGLTARLREFGDMTTRLDRMEPEMNHVPPGEVRDTTTPAAMARLVQKIALGDVLERPTRECLVGWMEKTQTGLHRLRAGLPSAWRVGDKTGTYTNGELLGRVNDVAVCWPPGRAPLIVAATYRTPRRGRDGVRDEDEAVLAEVGRIAAAWIA
ncbi:MAG: class A beta-lactamase [Rubrivivax sp.]|nr:MAG: class A beta-lactamase [Rubrivivax sp.]